MIVRYRCVSDSRARERWNKMAGSEEYGSTLEDSEMIFIRREEEENLDESGNDLWHFAIIINM